MKIKKTNKSGVLVLISLMILIVICGGCGQGVQQQESVKMAAGNESEAIEIESEPETIEAESEPETIKAESEPETIETEGESETAATESEQEASETESESETAATKPESTPVPGEPVKSKFEIVSEEIGLFVDSVEIDLPDVQNQYELLFVNDMHVLKLDDHVAADHVETVRIRQDIMFRTDTGMYSADTWLKLSGILDDFGADAVIFGGDMIDFASSTNVGVLSEGLSQIATPYIYLRADHDLGTWYSGGAMHAEDAMALHTSVCSYQDMFILEYPEFYVLGWNNSTSQLTDEGMEAVINIWDSGKPIILTTHVPLNSIVDNSLAEAAANVDPEGRKKLWGDGCLYQPYGNTSSFLEMIYDANSPVKAVFSGHLHFKHTVQLTEQTVEYVFAPAFQGKIAQIIIK